MKRTLDHLKAFYKRLKYSIHIKLLLFTILNKIRKKIIVFYRKIIYNIDMNKNLKLLVMFSVMTDRVSYCVNN